MDSFTLNGKAAVRCILLLSMASADLWACVCGAYPSVKQAWEQSPVVFTGYVSLAIPYSGMLPQLVVAHSEQSFKGSHKGELFTLLQPGHDCAPKFKRGERVLFYLGPSSSLGSREALGCGRTQSLETAADDLRFLHALPGSTEKNRLAGSVALYENSIAEGFRRVRDLSGIRVHLRSEKYSLDVLTANDGVYELYDLPPGKYRVAPHIPKGLKLYFPMIAGGEGRRSRLDDLRATEPVIEIGPRTAAHVSFVLMIDNQISGRALDSAGKGLKNICLQLWPAAGQASRYFYVFTCSEDDGSYRLKDMPPGQYVITAEPRVSSRQQEPTLYYPGTSERKSANVVTIGSGEHLGGFDFRIAK